MVARHVSQSQQTLHAYDVFLHSVQLDQQESYSEPYSNHSIAGYYVVGCQHQCLCLMESLIMLYMESTKVAMHACIATDNYVSVYASAVPDI